MRRFAHRLLALAAICLVLSGLSQSARACTGVVLRPDDKSTIAARTMEFGADMISFDLAVIPRGQQFTGQTPSGAPGLVWKAKYGQVGFAPFGLPVLADGMNERGLSCGAFYMPNYAEYQTVTEADQPRTISSIDFVSWVLANYATVAEVREALETVRVAAVKFPAWGFAPPLHYRVVDAAGNAIVVEYTAGDLRVFDMPLNVITNAPTYDWHQTNADNYVGLRALNHNSQTIDGDTIAPLGQGSGAFGLPGDFTPPSRFIRAAFFVQTVKHGRTSDDGINTAFHILNQFDIPRGSVADRDGEKTVLEVTQWTSAADLTNLRYFFHTEGNRRIRVVEFSKLDLGVDKIRMLPANNANDYQDVSSQFNGANAQVLSGPLPASTN